MLKYRFTDKGRQALRVGDRILEIAAEAAKDGIVTSNEVVELNPALTPMEADYILSVLNRQGYIEPVPIQGAERLTILTRTLF